MSHKSNIVIVGGGTAGWMAAAAFAKLLPKERFGITLIESAHIGTIGVGEATIPHIRQFNSMLGIDENDFIKATGATYKLAIKFENWGAPGSSYMHPFGEFGHDLNGIEFQHYWTKLKKSGCVDAYDNYSLAAIAARQRRFDYPLQDKNSILSTYSYAFHLDAGLYAKYLREYAEKNGVTRMEDTINDVLLHSDRGVILELNLASGARVKGDFFIDCSGLRSLLIGSALKVEFRSWQHWLLCDRAVAIPCKSKLPLFPYTRAIARKAGWQWRIPLQHRVGNGYVYSSQYTNEQDALDLLVNNIESVPTGQPNFIKFVAGMRKKSWEKNCIALGLAGGFLEPLESTSIYLIQMGILKFLELFPGKSNTPCLQEEFNRTMELEYVRIRDFLIVHYHRNQNPESEFWKCCREMPIPDSLQRKIDLFKSLGCIEKYQHGLFMTPSWLAVLLGQGLVPETYDSRVDAVPTETTFKYFQKLRSEIEHSASQLLSVEQAIERVLSSSGDKDYPHAFLSLYGIE